MQASLHQLTQYHIKNLEPFCNDPEKDVLFKLLSNQVQQNYVVFDKNKKYPVNLFLLRKGSASGQDSGHVRLVIFSNQMIHMDTIDVRQISSYILNSAQGNVFALKLERDRGDILFESNQRTELLFHLISCFERNNYDKFKIYTSENISLKQFLDINQIGLGTYESTLTIAKLQEKKQLVLDSVQNKLRASFMNFNAGFKARKEAEEERKNAEPMDFSDLKKVAPFERSKSFVAKSGGLDGGRAALRAQASGGGIDLPKEFKRLEEMKEIEKEEKNKEKASDQIDLAN